MGFFIICLIISVFLLVIFLIEIVNFLLIGWFGFLVLFGFCFLLLFLLEFDELESFSLFKMLDEEG